MSEEKDSFVELMLEKAGKKEDAKPQQMLSPPRDKEPAPQKGMSEDEIKEVENFTENLRKQIQK